MRSLFTALLVCLVFLAPCKQIKSQAAIPDAQDPAQRGPSGLSSASGIVVDRLISFSLFELESSRVALNWSKSQSVKDFADRMVADYAQAVIRLRQALAMTGAVMPALTLQARHQRLLHRLKVAPRAELDSIYVDSQHRAHVEAVGFLTSYARSGDNAQLRALAAELVPLLKGRLDDLAKLR